MKKKKILLLLALFLVAFITSLILVFFLIIKKDSSESAVIELFQFSGVEEEEKKVGSALSTDLLQAFNTAISEMNLPKESVVMVDSYYGVEGEARDALLFNSEANNREFYFASTMKPFYLSAVVNLTEIKSLNTNVSFKFVDEYENKNKIAQELYDKMNYGYDIDAFLVDYLLPYFSERPGLTIGDISNELMTAEGISNREFSLSEITRSLLGPSSNWAVVLLRNRVALNKGLSEKQAVSLVEDYINNFLAQNQRPTNVRIYLSEKSEAEKTYNSASFPNVSSLFESFFNNSFGIPSDIHEYMKTSMQEVSTDPVRFNRRHELKSISKEVFGATKRAFIVEKSGYIGLDYGETPALEAKNGWNQLAQVAGRRILIFNASTFARIYLNTGEYVQFNYAIAVPVQISLDPSYEELNDEYLVVKNKILDTLQGRLKGVIVEYKGEITVVKN